jgi:glycosyltransferase involved in cell wall biosynthesis
MRLLYFSPQQIFPVNSGSRLRNYNLARQLAARASVTVVEMGGAGQEQLISNESSDLANVVTLDKCRAYSPSIILRGLAGPTPMTVLNYWSPRSASQLADVLRSNQFDTVQIEGVHLIKFLPMIQKTPGCPAVVVDWHNIESELMWRYANNTYNWAKKIAARRTAKLIERVEDQLLDTCAMHTVTSERERQMLLARRPDSNIKVIPNGVDAGFYSAKEIADGCRKTSPGDSKPTILFVGQMNYHANIDAVNWFSRTAWPEIARMHPALHFTIVGRDPTPEVRALASDRIHVTGTVVDLRAFYASAVAAVVPLRVGSGTRLKILEAMAAGVPVISTKLGAEGINIEHDLHFLQADSGPDIAAAVHRIASSDETRSRLSQAGRELVRRAYDWSVIGKQLFRLHEELAESRLSGSLLKVS